jgi:hypothetical protein
VLRLQLRGQVADVDREAVVLRRDLDLVGDLAEHRLVGATVAELEVERLRSEGQAQQVCRPDA